MRDGVELVADHYRPLTSNPAGTLLVRGPYGRGYPVSVLFGAVYASRGYHVIVQSVRGTFGSGGDFDPFSHEIADGADTAAWLRDQPWFTGSFATIGASYLGFTQWALLTDPPPEMAAAVITVGPHDLSGPRWGTGSFGLNDFLGWSDVVAHQEDPGRIRAIVRQVRARRLLARATAGLPVGEAGRTLLGDGRAVVRVLARAPRARRPVLGAASAARPRLERAEIPGAVAHRLAGPVHRADAGAVCAAARARRARGRDHRTVEPHPHADARVRRPCCANRWTGSTRHLAGNRRRRAQPGAHPRQPRRLARPRRLAARDARAGAVSAAGRPPRRCGATRHRARRRRSPTTPRTRRRPSAAACCPRRAATATTPSSPNAPTC